MTDDAEPPAVRSAQPVGSRPGEGIGELASSARTVPRAARVRVGIGAAVVLVLAALGVAIAVAVFAPHGGDSNVPAVSATTKDRGSSTAATSAAAAVYVHVLGAVAHPGLYVLPTGARVVDAVGAAGGFAKNAEQGGVNLAQAVSDGEQIVVPVVGQVPPPGAAPAGGAVQGAAGPAASGAKVNLNTADQTQLETLPHIGPALAQRIFEWRTKNGRFASVQDLSNVTGIGQKTFDALKDLVTV